MKVRLDPQVANQPHTNDKTTVSRPIRRRLIMLQDIADQAELRAATLGWMIDSFPMRHRHDEVRALRETAARLRFAAASLLVPSSQEEKRSAEAS
jgi:hypothetical protein